MMVDKTMLAGRPAAALIEKLSEKIPLSGEELNMIEMRCRMIERELHHPADSSRTMARNELENILLLLQRADRGKTAVEPADPRIIKVIHRIETDYAGDLSIGRLASAVAMSPGHLSHLFKQQTRIGIKQYILQCRIAEARVSLETEEEVKLSALAQRLGFCDMSLFYRCFQRFTGMTPGAYRRISHKNHRIRQ